MPATDLVPCFYTGQDFRWEQPAEFRPRAELHRIKKLKVGRFDQDGRIFLFFKRIEAVFLSALSGPASAKTILAFIKTRTDGAKLHYETPMAGDGNWFDGYTLRKGFLNPDPKKENTAVAFAVSSRSRFNVQPVPAAPIRALA